MQRFFSNQCSQTEMEAIRASKERYIDSLIPNNVFHSGSDDTLEAEHIELLLNCYNL